MILCLDIGNTETTLGVFSEGVLKASFRCETKKARTADELLAFMYPVLQFHGIRANDIQAVAYASVVPSVDPEIRYFCRKYLKVPCHGIHPKMDLGFKIDLDIPSEVGADRLANAAYAVRKLDLPCIVVDFGTATTFDVVSSDKAFLGGAIVPGIKLGLEALSSKTAKLPLVDPDFPKRAIGKNTLEAIRSGTLWGYADLVSGMLERIEKELGEVQSIVLTGGLGFLFQSKLKQATTCHPTLTLEGIFLLYQENLL